MSEHHVGLHVGSDASGEHGQCKQPGSSAAACAEERVVGEDVLRVKV